MLKCMFFIYGRAVHLRIFTIKLCHDFTIISSRKSREINSRTVSVINWLAKIQQVYTDISVFRITIVINKAHRRFYAQLLYPRK